MEPQFVYPSLFQFFGGYFYPGWAADYRWSGETPNFRAVVRHFRAVNPPVLINQVRRELAELRRRETDSPELCSTLQALGSGFDPAAVDLSPAAWLDALDELLGESSATAIVLAEIRNQQ